MKMLDPEVNTPGPAATPKPTPAPTPANAYKPFSGPMRIEYAPEASAILGKDHWHVIEAFYYVTKGGEEVRVDRGYLTDGASSWRPFWWVIPPWGGYGQAVGVHDHLCEVGRVYIRDQGTLISSRATADRLFKDAMEALQIPRWKRNLMYIGVRLYAKFARPPVPNRDQIKAHLEEEWRQKNPLTTG